jgi:lipopolysaccharide export system protein LptA
MSMKRSLTVAVAAMGLSLAVGAAVAQTAGARANVSDQPIAIGAETGEYRSDGFSLRDKVEITQGANRLRAEAIEGRGAAGQFESITATGGVYYVTPTESIRGDRAVYTVSNATIVVTGNVILTQGQNVLTGSRLTYNVDTGAANMAGGSGGRIQGVFYPQKSGN